MSEDRHDTSRLQAAEARDEVVEAACRGLEWHGLVETAEQLRMTVDALSVRLAQAEQERDEWMALAEGDPRPDTKEPT